MTLKREDCDYASCYCEENVFRLAKRMISEETGKKLWAVFISNKNRAIPLFSQKMAKEKLFVVWDYHVILVDASDSSAGCRVWDFDSTLPFPCPVKTYFERTVEPRIPVDEEHRRFFRVIPAATYLENFSSDRSHMLNKNGVYSMPPPSWPAIWKNSDTLQKMITIQPDELSAISEVLDEEGFQKRFCSNS